MANNSEGIMARYKKYLTNQQKKKLRSLYAGYQQTTADERREAYLQARRAADRSAAAASAMGLGSGYAARKQAATNAELDKYGLQLNRQADAAFESNAVVPMANQTIKAQNEAARKAYERKRRAAQRAYQDALNKQAQQQTARLTKQERDRLKYYRYGQQYMDDALTYSWSVILPNTTAHQNAPKTTQTTNPRNNTHNRDKAYQYAQEWVDEAGATRPMTKRERDRAKANRYAQDWVGNAPKESPLKKGNGSAVNPKFDVSPKQPVVLPPEYAKEVEARVKDIKPGDVPQVKLDYLNEVNQYASLLQGLNEAYKPVGKMQDLANQYQQLVRDISDPTLSVAQRKQASVLAQQLEQEYREAYSSFNANKAGLQYLQNRVERAYGTLQIDRAVLGRLGVEMTEDDIGFNTGWAKTHGYIPETPEELFIATRDLIDNENETTDEFWKRAKNNSAVLFGYGDESGNYKNALGESTIPEEERKLVLDSQDETWMRENGFGWVIDGVAQMLENSNQYATFAQAAKAFLEQKEADEWQYFEERNVRRVLNRFNEIDDSEKDTVMSEGAKQTGIDLDRWDDIHAAWEGVSNYKFETDEDGQVRAVWKKTGNVLKDNALNRNAGNYVGGNIAAGQIEKKLGLPSRYLNTNTLAIMTKEDAAFINYCYGMGDKETARQYIYQLAELANQLVGKEKADKIAELPWGIRFAREAMDQFSYGVSSFHTGLADVFTNHRTPTTVKEVKSSAITENQRERGWGGAADVINPALVSAGNMAPSIALGYAGGAAAAALSNTAAGASTLGVLATEGLSHAGTISMGLSAGGKAKQEALRMGYGKDAANVYGIINGISETCLQEIMGGVVTLGQPQWLQTLGDSLLNSVKNPVARVMVRQALNAASETTEEVMQDILDPVFKGVSLNKKYLNDHPEAKQLLNTALSTVISTLLMNGLGGDILNTAKTETAVQRLSESYGLSVADARFMLNTYSTLMSKKGGDLDIEDYSKFNELASVIESNLPASVVDKIQKGETDLISYGTSRYGAEPGKLDRNIAKFSEGKQTETLDATDHTAELANLKGKEKAKYLIDASPTGKVGNLYFTTTDGKAMDVKNMGLTQKTNFNIAQKLAKAFPNIKIVAHDNLYGIDGVNHVVEGQAPEIHVSLNGSAMVMTTAAHELLHQVEKTDAKAYKNIQSYLTTLLDESEIATTEKNVASKYGIEYTVDDKGNKVFKDEKAQKTFESEVAAHLVEKVLTDDSFLDRIIRDSDPKNRTARAKLINGLKDVIDRVTKALRGEPTVSGKLYKLQRTIEKAYREMSKADLTATKTETEEADFEAVEKNQKEEAVKETTEKVEGMPTIEEAPTEEIEKNPGISFLGNRDTLGKTMDKNMEPMFRVSDWNADEDAYREMATRFNLFGSKAKTDEFFNMMRRVADNIAQQTEKGVKSLDYSISEDESMSDFHPEDWYDGDERTYSPVKPNSDPLYKWSIDFSTLCRKRLLQQAVQKRLEAQLKRNLSVDEQIAIRNALKNLQNEGKKIEVACALCYVEAARFRSPKQISRFMNDRQGFLLKQIQDKALADEFKAVREEVKEEYGVSDMKALRKNAKAKAEFTDRINELRDNYKPTAKEQALLDAVNDYDVTDFTTPAGLEKLARENRELYDAYTTFIRQATKSKALETSTPWRAGDSEKISDAEFQAFNSENGLRSNSWSDFQVMHLLDYISSIIELSTRNAKMQAYTKVANYARLMGDTGVMINLSLIPTAKYTKGSKMDNVSDYDPVEGMDYTLALQLRKEHANTVGTICIATNDEQLEALCANPNVDMVIPYHDSGMSKANRKKMGIPDWQSYQKVQSDKEVTLPKEAQTEDYHKPIKFSDWFDYDEAVKTAKKKGAFAAMEEAARKYLDLCEERGYTPKFADYTKVKGYWKLLTDRKMINQETGEIIKQEAVKPIFDEGTINSIIKEEVDNYAEFSKDFDAASDAVFEQFKDGNFKTTAADKRLADSVNNAYISAVMGDDMMRVGDYPVTNAGYMNAIEDGDMDAAKEILEEAANEAMPNSKAVDKNGRLMRFYHGTKEQFNEFKRDKIGSTGRFEGSGFNFTPSEARARSYGGNVLSGYIDIQKPLSASKKTITVQQLAKIIRETDPTGDNIIANYAENTNDYGKPSFINRESLHAARMIWEYADSDVDIYSDISSADPDAEGLIQAFEKLGYDGLIHYDTNGNIKTVVTFNSHQFKLADVTHDDNGNVIPLYDRFNTDEEDIRYRISDYSEDETIVGTPIDTAAVRRAVKTGKKQTTKDGEVINTREGVANEELKGADIERTAAALMRNIKKGRANSNNTSTSDIYIEKGENPARDVNVPKSARQGMKTSKLARTIAEAPGMTEESVDELMNKVYRGFMSYKPDVNQESMDKALDKLKDNPAAATTEWNKVANSGRILTPDDVALGSALMVSASQSGDVNSAMEIASQLQDLATTGGKLVQSFRMIKRLGAAGAFYYVNRQVAKINAELEKQAKGYKPTLNEELVQNLLNARDYHDIREATEALRKDLGQQLKPTLRDWLTAWRYTAMLGNAKTLVRNDIGNAAYVPVIMMDNVLNAIGQTFTSAVSKGKFEKTTKLFAGKEYRDFANWDWNDTVKYDIKGNKYSEGQLGDIKDYMRYDTHAKGILKPGAWVFEKWRSGTQKFMEDEAKLGDMAFKKLHYQHALATRLDQLKVDVKALQDVLVRSRNNETFEKGTREAKLLAVYEAATQYAVSEANRNTYNDINAFASFVSQMSRTMYDKEVGGKHPLRPLHYALEGVLPFKNTPANIVARAAEHSPIGLAKTLTLDLGKVIKGTIAEQQFAKGKISKQKYENLITSSISGEQFIHNLSAGLTGSALFALGAILAKAGILRGGLGYDDKDDKEKKRRGRQSYSLEIGNTSITLDWLAPECIPLFMGVELFEQLGGMSAEDWSEKGLKALLNVTTGAFEPMLNMSMLSGINALFEGFTSTDDLQGIEKVAATVATSYLTQFQPTILGQFARTIDPTRRTTYYDKNAKIPPFMQKFWQTALKKIPGATFLLQPYVDEFGNTSKTFENYGSGAFWLNMAEQFFSPAYRSKLTNTAVDQEIERLGEDVYPSKANKYINFDKQKYNLSADEYTAYATLRGETAYALVQNMIGTDAYNALSDAEKVAAFKGAYSYADTIAKSTILGMRGVIGADPGALESWVGKANEYAKAVGTPDAISQFIAVKQGLKANGITNSDDRAQFLWQQNIPAENKALLMEMNDGSNGGYADGTAFYNKKGELIVDFGGERPAIDTAPTAEPEAAAEAPAVEDKYVEATNTVKKMNAEESTAYLNTTSFTSEEKYQILAKADKNDPRAKNAEAFHATYGLSYDDMWDVHSKYNSETFHGYDFQKYVDGKKGLKGRQKFALVELANTQSAWLEKAQSINSKMGISYDTLWKIKLYWSSESGQGKKARITAYCKSLGLKQSQIDKLYNEYKFLS